MDKSLVAISAFLLGTIAPMMGIAPARATDTLATLEGVNPLIGGIPGYACCEDGNDHRSTWAANDGQAECLVESPINGTMRLEHRWAFVSVPAGTQYLRYAGATTGETFRFLYNETGSLIKYLTILDAKIDADTAGLVQCVPLGRTTQSPTTFYLLVSDINSPDTFSDTVYVDYLMLNQTPCPETASNVDAGSKKGG